MTRQSKPSPAAEAALPPATCSARLAEDVTFKEILDWHDRQIKEALSQRPPNMDYYRAMERGKKAINDLLNLYITANWKLRADADFADLGRPLRSQYEKPNPKLRDAAPPVRQPK